MQRDVAAENIVQDKVDDLERNHRQTIHGRPEQNDLAAGIETCIELPQDQSDLLFGKMLHDAEIVDALELAVRGGEVKNIAQNSFGCRAVPFSIKFDSVRR